MTSKVSGQMLAPKADVIKQVSWFPPKSGWIKCNSDGSARGCPGPAASGAIFRNNNAVFLGCFSYFLGSSTAFYAEFMAAILAIEFTAKRGWNNLWLECDSTLVIASFSSHDLVPW